MSRLFALSAFIGVALVTVAASIAGGAPSEPDSAQPRALAAATCGKLLPPRSGMYFGAFPDFYYYPTTGPVFEEDYVRAWKVNDFERLIGHKIVWADFAQRWFKGLSFPGQSVLTLWRNGQIPLVRFEPESGYTYGPFPPLEQFPEQQFSLQHIIEGQFDPELRAWADAARDTNIPILAELGDEVNGSWPWSPVWNGAGQTDGYGDPAYPDGAERFRDANRHIVTLFRQEGATNVTWFFHVDAYRQNDWWNEFKWYYPGDYYIDWLGISNFGANLAGQPVYGFADKLDSSGVYDELSTLSQRPMAVLATGVVESPTKPSWIHDTFAVLKSGRYPRLHGVAWWNAGNAESNLPVDSSPNALAAFRRAIADPFFGAPPRFTGDCLPTPPTGLIARRWHTTVKLRWRTRLDATSYEIWRGRRRLGATTVGHFVDRHAGREPAVYRIRGRNPVGYGPFSRSVTVR